MTSENTNLARVLAHIDANSDSFVERVMEYVKHK